MLALLRLHCRKLDAQCRIVNSYNKGGDAQWRRLGTSSWWGMPRGVGRLSRIQTVQEDESESLEVEDKSDSNRNLNEWGEFINQKKLSDDNRIISQFGNIRFDKDNVPRLMNPTDKTYEEMEEEKELELSEKDIQSKNYMITRDIPPEKFDSAESMFFEGDSFPKDEQSYIQEEKPIKQSKNNNKKNQEVPQKEKSSKVNEKITKLNEKYAKKHEKSVKTNESDLNYFDEVAFGDKYREFDPAKVNTNHPVLPGPVSGNIGASLQDLSFVDEQYLGSSREMLASSEIQNNVNQSFGQRKNKEEKQDINESKEENFIDDQYFIPSKYDPKKETTEEIYLDETTQIKTDEQYFTPQKYIPQKVVKQEINSDKIKDDKYKNERRERKKKGCKVVESSAALEYVRNLRKERQDAPTLRKDPVSEIGRTISSKLAEASFPLVTKVNRKKAAEEEDINLESKSYKSIETFSPPNLKKYISTEVEQLLSSKILYNDNEVIGIWKPYGLPMFSSNTRPDEHSLEKYLPFIANQLGYKQLYEVHRLDSTTTGVVLFATSEARRKHLKQLLAAREIVKTYYAITNGIPSPHEGIISIPIGEGKIGDRYRPTLKPDYSSKTNKIITNKKTSKSNSSPASTEYRVLSHDFSASLVEILMVSGIKHQIRVHLGLGLGTPILGDSKYSYPDQLGPPQKVKGSIVNKLGIKSSQTRNLPIFLHSKRISIPDILPNQTLTIMASKPHFFNKVQKRLRLKEP